MKKTSIILSSVLCLLYSQVSLAYTSNDTSNASSLADQGIIVKHSVVANYRLDSTITRAEAIGIALKIKGITLPEQYTCKNYFTDVKYDATNNWKCRAIELAADNGIVSRNNAQARPSDNISRAEALAIVMKAQGEEGVTQNKLQETLNTYGSPFDRGSVEWQQRLVIRAEELGIIEYYAPFYPNRAATRAEVFGFAKKIIDIKGWNNDMARVEFDIAKYPQGSIFKDKTLSFGNKVLVNDEGGSNMVNECVVVIGNAQKWGMSFSKYANILGMKKQNDIPYFTVVTDIGSQSIKILGNNYEYDLYDHSSSKNCLSHLQFNNLTLVTNDLAISTYYNFLNSGNLWAAYNMRSPSGASFETFQSWYKNVSKVDLIESSLTVLGDNTFEFQVQLTENGVVNTYKAKSKVNMDNFTIDNISSVKI